MFDYSTENWKKTIRDLPINVPLNFFIIQKEGNFSMIQTEQREIENVDLYTYVKH